MAADGYSMQSGPWVAPKTQKFLAGRTARDVESDVALEARPVESLDNLGRGGFGRLVGPSKTFVKESNNSLEEGARDQDQLSFGVLCPPVDDDSVVDRGFTEQLCETLEMATQGQ